ncbi:LLM class flavin-dependent oxidoreductase [Pseudolysinimonas kribbensis]|uniref:LLM class flavin-dependent oxidoreductase n=1 Tax=Pseudolysinimonas kribbensis TaxID=433641 RepID=UPI0031D1EE6A
MTTFGIKTAPMHVSYDDIVRVWREADELPEIADAWLWDHLLPLAPPADGPIFEGWTLLSALAAQTERLGLGLLVTSNRLRSPAHLGKIASTVDAISHGRLTMGLGVGGTVQPAGVAGFATNPAAAEYAAYGVDLVPAAEGVRRLIETLDVLDRMWTGGPFDFDGPFSTLRGTVNRPAPSHRPPLLIGAWGDRMLRLVAERADVWNIPGPPHTTVDAFAERSRRLDALCAELGRDPSGLGRSVQLTVAYDDLPATRSVARQLIESGASHVVLNLPRGYPQGIVRRIVGEVVGPLS